MFTLALTLELVRLCGAYVAQASQYSEQHRAWRPWPNANCCFSQSCPARIELVPRRAHTSSAAKGHCKVTMMLNRLRRFLSSYLLSVVQRLDWWPKVNRQCNNKQHHHFLYTYLRSTVQTWILSNKMSSPFGQVARYGWRDKHRSSCR